MLYGVLLEGTILDVRFEKIMFLKLIKKWFITSLYFNYNWFVIKRRCGLEN